MCALYAIRYGNSKSYESINLKIWSNVLNMSVHNYLYNFKSLIVYIALKLSLTHKRVMALSFNLKTFIKEAIVIFKKK